MGEYDGIMGDPALVSVLIFWTLAMVIVVLALAVVVLWRRLQMVARHVEHIDVETAAEREAARREVRHLAGQPAQRQRHLRSVRDDNTPLAVAFVAGLVWDQIRLHPGVAATAAGTWGASLVITSAAILGGPRGGDGEDSPVLGAPVSPRPQHPHTTAPRIPSPSPEPPKTTNGQRPVSEPTPTPTGIQLDSTGADLIDAAPLVAVDQTPHQTPSTTPPVETAIPPPEDVVSGGGADEDSDEDADDLCFLLLRLEANDLELCVTPPGQTPISAAQARP